MSVSTPDVQREAPAPVASALQASRLHVDTEPDEQPRTHGNRIVKMDLSQDDLRGLRSMFADESLTEVYIRTDSYDGEPEALVDVVEILEKWPLYRRMFPDPGLDRINRRRLDNAFRAIGHQGSPIFRRSLAVAYDRVA